MEKLPIPGLFGEGFGPAEASKKRAVRRTWCGTALTVASLGLLGCATLSPSQAPPNTNAPAQSAIAQPTPAPAPSPTQTPAPSPAPSTSAHPTLSHPAPRSAVITQSVQLGKYPEQIALVGDSAWIGCSGARVVTQVDLLTGRVVRSAKTGAFPVAVAAFGNIVYSVDYNSGQGLFTIDSQGVVKRVGRVPDHPELMVADAHGVYVLLWLGNSSSGSSIVRIDPSTQEQARSQDLGPNALGFGIGGGKLWVAAAQGLVAVDPATLAIIRKVNLGAPTHQAAANSEAAYTNTAGPAGDTLARVDGASFAVTQVPLGEKSVLVANNEYVFALGGSGTLRLFDARTLERRSELSLGRRMDSRHLVRYGSKLLVTEHEGDGPGRLTTIELKD